MKNLKIDQQYNPQSQIISAKASERTLSTSHAQNNTARRKSIFIPIPSYARQISCSISPSHCKQMQHLQIFHPQFKNTFQESNSKQTAMRSIQDDDELMRKLEALKSNMKNDNEESIETYTSMNDYNHQSEFKSKYYTLKNQDKKISLLKNIAVNEELPNIANIIEKARLDMPITSFGIQLSQEAQQKIYHKIQMKKSNSQSKLQPTPSNGKKTFYKDMSLSQNLQNQIYEVDVNQPHLRTKPLFIIREHQVLKNNNNQSRNTGIPESRGNSKDTNPNETSNNKNNQIQRHMESLQPNLQTTKNASINRKAYLQSTLYLEKNMTKDFQESIRKVKPLIDPFRYQQNPGKMNNFKNLSRQQQQQQQQQSQHQDQVSQSDKTELMAQNDIKMAQAEFHVQENENNHHHHHHHPDEIQSLTEESFNIKDIEKNFFNDDNTDKGPQQERKYSYQKPNLNKKSHQKSDRSQSSDNDSDSSSSKNKLFNTTNGNKNIIFNSTSNCNNSAKKGIQPIEKMFEKERDFRNLKLGCKATVFERDPNIVLNMRKGNYTLIKYTNFT
ncbi:UNKNOWN [Stylonychia lemnae]|uniref:Uncharacterized protein n=1 Tax=Stylonychia lemnae TaxID=5949 RepID=A0A078A0Z0_STYLE|nr:UNKNOWN [Stylonychia lemnae]|eukprot:CDW75527.1 UNKNOWN [Stylonychia lemnae]